MPPSVLRAKTPKGAARLQAIMDATLEIIVADGLGAASQDAIAQRARVTQSAVRHYFPTKESLLKAFFLAAIDRLQQAFDTPPPGSGHDPQGEVLRLVQIHLDAILDVDRVFFFEALAYWTRDSELSAIRKAWHGQVLAQYEDRLRQMHPAWSTDRVSDTALQVLTLVQGCWLTLDAHEPHKTRREAVLGAVTRLIDNTGPV